MKTNNLLLIFILSLTFLGNSQCYDDYCIDAPSQTTPVPGCCTGTTVGMTASYSGTYNGCPLTNGQDAWMTFMAPTNGYLQVDFNSIFGGPSGTPIAGDVTLVIFDSFSNSDNCATLAAGGVIAAIECFDASTPPNPINLNYVQAGERYFILVSTQSGSTPGDWEICLSITVPTGGTDCTGATDLCDKSSINLEAITAGGGSVSGDESMEDVSTTTSMFGQNNSGLNGSCFGDGPGDGGGEVNSQWYLFTCGQSGTLQMALYPLNTTISCPPSLVGDDYDWMLLDVSTTLAQNPEAFTCNINGSDFGGVDSATVMSCNWYGSGTGTGSQNGLTGFGAGNAYSSVFGYTGTGNTTQGGCQTTDNFIGESPGNGPAGGGNGWEPDDVNIVCGNTYALLVSNYTGASTSGFNLQWGGTGLFGVQGAMITDPVAVDCAVTSTITAPLCSGSMIWSYDYEINWGDGTTTYATTPNISHTYPSSGTYTITMVVTDPVGCTQGISKSVTTVCILPVELTKFDGFEFGDANRLIWQTATETNSDYFVVEKSLDMDHWSFAGQIDAAGNSQSTVNYTLDDDRPYSLTYYRLKQFDTDGAYEVYPAISIARNLEDGQLFSTISPNPTNGSFSFAYNGYKFNSDVIVQVLATDGRLCHEQIFSVSGSKVLTVDCSALAGGNYIVSFTQDDNKEIQHLVLNK